MAFVSGYAVGTKSFLGSASRCVSKKAVASRSTVMMAEKSASVPFLPKPKNTVGLIASAEFDPLFISDYVPIKFLQEAELKHGRVCMLAALGFLVQEFYTFGGSYFPKMNPIDAHDYYMKTGGMSQILLFIAIFEGISYYALKQTMEGKREPGDFGFDPLGLGKSDEALKKFRANEIKNGRLAMIAVGGFIHQAWLTKMGVIEQLQAGKFLP